jgi:Thiopurine S-methyltransferase (TPMT)
MTNFEPDLWNERYSKEEFLYGQNPNQFFKSHLVKLNPDRLYLPGDGEGRNSAYAASLGWQVDAVDFSSVAIERSKILSKSFKGSINYNLADLTIFVPKSNFYNAVAIIFVHLQPQSRKSFHNKIVESLANDGILIIEVYEKKQLGKNSGGPQSEEMLYSINEIQNDFSNLMTLYLKDELIELKESEKHSGSANVIRYIGQKK